RVAWERFALVVIVDLFHWIMQIFEQILERFDRLLYEMDEWLRFRGGQGRGTLVMKALLDLGWSFFAYIARFGINLLVEPQINPIKHFPVVTVSHKLILPSAGKLALALETLG